MISEVLDAVDRKSDTTLDNKAKFWIQNAIDFVFAALPKRERQRTATLTTVASQQYVDVPTDYGNVVEIKNSSNQKLNFLTPAEFFTRHASADAEGTPVDFTFWNNQFLFNPIPDSILSLDLLYEIDRPNIYTHNLTIDHQASMTGYVQVYIDEDGVSSGEGKLLFVSPTTTDAKVLIGSADGHQHELIVYHDTNAATKGVAWYFDENAANAWERNFFVSPTKAETVVKTENYRNHHHYLYFIHNPDPTAFPDGDNVAVYLDEDANDRTLRLAFTSPSTTDGTDELTHSKQGEFPGFLERYHSAVFYLAVSEGWLFNKRPDLSENAMKKGSALLSLLAGNPAKTEGKISDTEAVA